MVGARVEVLGEPGRHLLAAAVGDQRVDERVAAAVAQVLVAPAQAAQVAGVVDQPEVRAAAPSGARSRAPAAGRSPAPPSAPGPAAARGRGWRAPGGCARAGPGREWRRRSAPRPGAAPSGPARPAPGCRPGRRRRAARRHSSRASRRAWRTAAWPRGGPRPRRAGTGRGGGPRPGANDAATMCASSCHMFTMLVATVRVVVASRICSGAVSWPLGEPPSHSVPKPSRSRSAASSGVTWPEPRQIPNRPRWSRAR